jgi:hypothetical protein
MRTSGYRISGSGPNGRASAAPVFAIAIVAVAAEAARNARLSIFPPVI